jgi:hypothetical protein
MPRPSMINEEAFEHECWRLWEEAVQVVGCDPTGISDLVWKVVGDPWSSVKHIPRYGNTEQRATPAIMPKSKRRSNQ